jgi:phospholipase C
VVTSRVPPLALLALGLLAGSLCYLTPANASASPSRLDEYSKIQHIVFIVQENRSFNNLFLNYPGATTSKTGKCLDMSNGGKISTVTLVKTSMAISWDISHGLQDAKTAYDKGAMDGFCNEYAQQKYYNQYAYAYVPEKQIEPYWDMAKEYVLADHMFTSQLDGSFVAHQYLISGWAGGAFNYPASAPWGCDGGAGDAVGVLNAAGQPAAIAFPCFTYTTIATELNAKNISWRTYSPPWSPSPTATPPNLGYYLNGFDAIKQIREGPDWVKDNYHPETRILKDIKDGNLADVTWVIPSLLLSDHAGSNSDRGPSWVAAVVDAIGESKYWSSTAIFVTWDDWGGWYDPVTPPQLDYDGLGMRVPLLCISPYAKSGYVDHTQYEFGSLLKFVEDRYGLPSLGRADKRSNAPSNCFNMSQSPRKFEKIPPTYSLRDVMAHVTDLPADDQ